MPQYDLFEPNNPMFKAMSHFLDALSFEEVAQELYLYPSWILEQKIATIEDFMASDYDLIDLRDFVELEMSWAIGDPTGKAQLQWMTDALALMKDVLKKIVKNESA